jgi:phosphate transport system substrate-binding protein
MARQRGTHPIVFFLIFIALSCGGYWYFFKRETTPSVNTTIATPTANGVLPSAPIPSVVSPNAVSFTVPVSVPPGTIIKINGATSMVTINQNLKNSFEKKYSGTKIDTKAEGSDKGILDLLMGNIDLAALSRPLTAQEKAQGLVEHAIATDQIAVVVGKMNPFKGSLTRDQIVGIFTGKITNWSAVGGASMPIQVINRPAISGTHQTFRELVLNKQNFGTTPNIKTLDQDTTTLLLRALGNNGIGYATFAQAVNQQTVRTIPIDGIMPGTQNYPFKRQLYYVYKNPPNTAVKLFLGNTKSPEGQKAILGVN